MKKAIVTGGTGVTGNALIRYLIETGCEVTALIRPGSIRAGYLPDVSEKFHMIEANLGEYGHIEDKHQYMEQTECFFHLAWEGSKGKEKLNNRNNYEMQAKNVLYDLEAVELCHRIGCACFVATGSQAEYGTKNTCSYEKDICLPENGYGAAKFSAGMMTRMKCQEYGIKHIWARLFSVYGPYDQTESLIDTTVRKLLKGELPKFTEGLQKWDYLYSEDAARALTLLAELGENGETYNVAAGKVATLREYINTIYQVVAPDRTPCFGQIPYQKNQSMFLGADIEKLKKRTHFIPRVDFATGIENIMESIQNERTVKSCQCDRENHQWNRILRGQAVFCFDIDGVIARYNPSLDYESSEPYWENIHIVNKLFQRGNKIILFTARGSQSGINWEEITKSQMKKWNVSYTELLFGKPAADYYIDDKNKNLTELAQLGIKLDGNTF